MAAPYLLQLPDPDTFPARYLVGGFDSLVIYANNATDATAMAVGRYGNIWKSAIVTPSTIAAASDMSGWALRVQAQKVSDGSFTIDTTVKNAGQVEHTVLATGVLTSSENYGTSDTVTLGTRVYHFVASVGTTDGNVKIGASESASITNLVNAINGSGGTPGTDYYVLAADPNVTAVAAAHTATVTANASLATAAIENAVATTASMTTGNGAWGNTTLTGATDSTNAMSSLAELMVSALVALGYHAGFVNSTHTLTVASIADNIGDHVLSVYVYPPSLNYPSDNGAEVYQDPSSNSVGVNTNMAVC